MADVAARAGVSRALVSIVFRDAPGASPQTRQRVRAAAAELGYRPDQRAQLLSRSRTGLIGVAFGVRQAFHADLVEALYVAAEDAGYDLVLSGVTPARGERTAVDALLAYRCEAVICLGPTLPVAELVALARRLPTLVMARRLRAPSVDVVRTDDVAGMRLAVRHLTELGHTRIAHIDGGSAPGAADRRRGFRTAVRRAGLDDDLVVGGGLTEHDGILGADRLMATHPGLTAIAAFNDRSAAGVLQALRAAGREVPADMSVIGFDDDRLASLPHLDLTTVRQDATQLAGLAVRRLAERLEPGQDAGSVPTQDVVVAPHLVVRATTAAPPGAVRPRR
jgi:DNA-binding LacI/PurR family transcriptional regulator